MGFQNKAGSIIIDATLTDVGRRYMAQGKMEIRGDSNETENLNGIVCVKPWLGSFLILTW